MENNAYINGEGMLRIQRLLDENPEGFQKKLERSLEKLEDLYLGRNEKEFTEEIISKVNTYWTTLNYLKVPKPSNYDHIRELIVNSIYTLNLMKVYIRDIKEKTESSDMPKDIIQPIGDSLGREDILYQREIKIEGQSEYVKPSLDPQPLDDMISYLKMLGFEDADSITFPFKAGKIIMYGSRFNEIALGIINIKSGELKEDEIKELEERIEALHFEVSKDSHFGNAFYRGDNIGYHKFIPKIGEFLKNEVKKLKRKSINDKNSIKFSSILGELGLENNFDIVGCNDFAKYILFEYYRVMKEVIKSKSNLEEINLKNLHREEIPMIQGTARLNAYKMLGSVVYHGREMSINHFSDIFSEELKGLIENVCKDVEVGVNPCTDSIGEILLENLIEE